MTTLDPGPRTRPGPGARPRPRPAPSGRGPAGTADRAARRGPLLARPLASYYLLLSTSGLLLVFGLVMVLSASSVRSFEQNGSSYTIFSRQVMWTAIGLPLLVAASRLRTDTLRTRVAYPLLGLSLIALCAVLVPGIGVSINDARRWIGVGSYTIQPSEITKLALALWGADLLVRKQKLLREWKHLLVPLLPVGLFCCFLVMLEPDMGTTIVLLCVLLALLWVVGAPARLFSMITAGIVTVGAFLAVVEPYRLARLANFRDPFKTAHGTGFQAVQGLYALASGGWWGEGLGASREKWPGLLPNAHTDFILAIIGEELGLVGTLLLVGLFVVLAYTGVRIAHRSADPFARLAAVALTAWIVGQAVINMGAVVGLLPITGIPLPLVSFGGSSLVPTLVAIGILLSFARREPAAAALLDERRDRRRRARTARRAARGDGLRAVGRRLRPSSPDHLVDGEILVAPRGAPRTGSNAARTRLRARRRRPH